ncbi:hypothetical protein WNY61_03420 [Sulfitobacter sp. AS92]|uniref:hypothetical protein n=1 Tax=Sulfitobacter sp. AS92 TaxID=3135783 RepID=UPI0031727FAF
MSDSPRLVWEQDLDKVTSFLKREHELSHGDGGGDGGMIERIVKLESAMDHVQRDVTDLRGDMKDVRDRLKGLEVKVDHLPSKGFIVSAVLAALAVIAALLTYQDKLQALLNAG